MACNQFANFRVTVGGNSSRVARSLFTKFDVPGCIVHAGGAGRLRATDASAAARPY
jgi:hypothetical protein